MIFFNLLMIEKELINAYMFLYVQLICTLVKSIDPSQLNYINSRSPGL